MTKTLWMAGHGNAEGTIVDIMGVFSTQERAEACSSSPNLWVAPLTLDEAAPEETVMWPGAYMPHAGKS